MTTEQMRKELIKAYANGPKWADRVRKMTDNQVFATYSRLKREGRIK